MQSMVEFLLAVLVLLLTPGPTNTLLAVSGASVGIRRSLPLIAGEISGYLVVILPLVLVAAPWLEQHPGIAMALRLCSAAWVLFLAFRLWTLPGNSTGNMAVTVPRVFVTTMLNPKALIIALVLMPADERILPFIVALSGLIVVVAMVWIISGYLLIGRASRSAPWLVRRVAAGFLLVFSAGIAGTTLGVL